MTTAENTPHPLKKNKTQRQQLEKVSSNVLRGSVGTPRYIVALFYGSQRRSLSRWARNVVMWPAAFLLTYRFWHIYKVERSSWKRKFCLRGQRVTSGGGEYMLSMTMSPRSSPKTRHIRHGRRENQLLCFQNIFFLELPIFSADCSNGLTHTHTHTHRHRQIQQGLGF